MPRIAKQLSDRAVAAIKTEGRHPVGGVAGLHLRVTGEGHRGWVLRLQVGEKRTDYGLGPYPEVSLVDAREKARAMRAQINAGEVPVGHLSKPPSKPVQGWHAVDSVHVQPTQRPQVRPVCR